MVRHIDEQKTLNQEQVDKLIEAAKDTPIYLQVMFAVLMGLRRSEIIAVKYSDIDYINRTIVNTIRRGAKLTTFSKKSLRIFEAHDKFLVNRTLFYYEIWR